MPREKSSAYPFLKASLWTQERCTHAWGSDLEPVRNLLCEPQFPL